jgi:hypothetical protein
MATTEVKVQVTADGSQVPREADKIKKSIAGIGKEGDALGKSFAKLGGVIAGALSVGAISSFLSRVNQAADQLDGLSQRLGASASGLQTLQVIGTIGADHHLPLGGVFERIEGPQQ